MKRYYFTNLFFALILSACSSTQGPQSQSTPAIQKNTSDSPGFKLRDYKVEQWPNGLEVITIEDRTLPSIGFGLLLKDGSTSDPMAKTGAMNLMTQAMGRGTTKLSAAQIADGLGQLGSELEQSVGEDYSWFQVSGLSLHQVHLWEIFSDVLLNPSFNEQEILREKKKILAGINRRVDHPDRFASEAFESYLFGGHPYGRPISGLERDVNSITRKDIIKLYMKRFRPNNAVLVITGDLNSEMLVRIKSSLTPWTQKPLESKNYTSPPEINGVNIRLIDKPDLTQTQIILGHMGVKRTVEDYLQLRVATTVLGGNFSSRLMDRIRVQLGLTYGISSSFDARLDRGPFFISTFTKNESTALTINETLKVFNEYYSSGVTKDEVEAAKNYMMGSFPRSIETSERLGFNLAILRLYGLPDDYLRNFVSNVENISASDVNASIKKHLNPKDLKILVLSKSTDVIEQVRPIGLLEVKKYQEIF
ncbi:MAG: pitrilysin family protein [Oligoflexia bacterium]|nr:pitrilysin family protein [Oligoflexia bacterium]